MPRGLYKHKSSQGFQIGHISCNKNKIPWNKGKHPSIETRKKMSESHIGKKFSDEHRNNMSKNNGRYWLGKKRKSITD